GCDWCRCGSELHGSRGHAHRRWRACGLGEGGRGGSRAVGSHGIRSWPPFHAGFRGWGESGDRRAKKRVTYHRRRGLKMPVSEVATGTIDALKAQPATFAMIVIAFGLLAYTWYTSAQFNNQQLEMSKLMLAHQNETQQILSRCIEPIQVQT